MAFVTIVLVLIVVYVRPGEVVPALEDYPLAVITLGLAACAALVSFILRPFVFWRQPLDRYVLGFFAAAVLSNLSWGWAGGAYLALVAMTPVVLTYFLLRAALQTPAHLRWTGYVLVALTLFQAVNGIRQYRSGVGLGGVAALQYGSQGDDYEEVRRIRGTGIFNDPNDLAMALVAAVPFLIGPIIRKRSRLPVRLAFASGAVAEVLAIFYTSSRGGMLGLGAMVVSFALRLGRAAGVTVAAVALVVLVALAPSRMVELDSSEDSAQGRIQAWSAGLEMLKSRPVLGVGYGRYTEFNHHVAHNSFVHVAGELGMVGAFFFTGMMYWLLRGIRTAPAGVTPGLAGDFEIWRDDLRIGSLGLFVCALFLSRQYNMVLFIWLALSASSRHVANAESSAEARELRAGVVWALTLLGVVVVYVLVRLLAVWGG
ncbi:MAG: O-antigen ligase family protein [Vicinamibacterales bacterium]